jgi:peptide-methionine (S)-S-oxide reductase
MKLFKNVSIVLSLLLLVGSCSAKQAPENPEPKLTQQQIADLETAYFASGCFWCTEAVFERVKGVKEAVSGYAGGNKPDPTYEEVAGGNTEYAEAVRVRYDSEVVTYRQLIEIFYGSHDPTQLNRQGPDVGPQYRSAIFYQNEEELNTAKEVKQELEKAGKYDEPIVTKFTSYDKFYEAEEYHQGYYAAHPNNPYIANVSQPKVEKFEKEFKDLLKDEYK